QDADRVQVGPLVDGGVEQAGLLGGRVGGLWAAAGRQDVHRTRRVDADRVRVERAVRPVLAVPVVEGPGQGGGAGEELGDGQPPVTGERAARVDLRAGWPLAAHPAPLGVCTRSASSWVTFRADYSPRVGAGPGRSVRRVRVRPPTRPGTGSRWRRAAGR